MLNTIRENKLYFSLLGIYFCVVGSVLLASEKGDAVLFLNKTHNPFFDFLFKYSTLLGDGWFVVPLVLFFLLFKSKFEGIVLTTGVLLTFLIIQFLKNVPFSGAPRPSVFFSPEVELYLVPGVTIHAYNSFPSGHSGQAFVLFLLLSFFSKNKNWTFLYFVLAALTAISRVYLAQHFLIDTYVGGLIGTLLGFFVYLYFKKHSSLSSAKNLQKGFFS